MKTGLIAERHIKIEGDYGINKQMKKNKTHRISLRISICHSYQYINFKYLSTEYHSTSHE